MQPEDELTRRTDIATSAVIREALSSIVREMRRSMVQSSYSSIIYEGYDFSCVLIDEQGRLIAESGEDHPFHIIPVAGAVRARWRSTARSGLTTSFYTTIRIPAARISTISPSSGRSRTVTARSFTSLSARIGAMSAG